MIATATTASDLALHPEHLADLRRSGLKDGTIESLGIVSARPGDIVRHIGWDPPSVQSALVFPYPGEEAFCRLKVFPPYRDHEGHFVKYLQRLKSRPCFYIPPLARTELKDFTKPLAWTEGEKKAAKACQEGVACIGLGGLWNWLTDGHPLSSLDEIAHADREEILYPDSDVWSRPDLLHPVFAFGKEVEGRGAKVSVALIPPGPGGEKRGLDDYLMDKDRAGVPADKALGQLERLLLKHNAFRDAAQWWKEWVTRQGGRTAPPPDAVKLLEKLECERKLYPAQDFIDGRLHFGVVVGEDLLLVTSDRTLIRADQLPEGQVIENRGFDLCRFSKDGILAFQGGRSVPGHTLLKTLETYFRRFVAFRDSRIPLLLATWTMATYTYTVFRVMPYLAFRSPEKRCGKSRVLDLLSLVAFNASSRITNPTEAQLFRGPSKNGGTVLLDEIEHLRGDKEAFAGLLSVLNSGFERGGMVSRLEKRGECFTEIQYPTYAPRALAGIAGLAETLEDRTILIFMARKLKREEVERFSPRHVEREAQSLRDQLYIWALTHAADLAEVYDQHGFPFLRGLDDRARDLWEPLFSISELADEEAEEDGEPVTFTGTLAKLVKDLSGGRDDGDSTTAVLIGALLAIVDRGDQTFTPTALLGLLQTGDLAWLRSAKALAKLLNPLGIFKKSHRLDGKPQKVYFLDPKILSDAQARYGPPVEESKEGEVDRHEG